MPYIDSAKRKKNENTQYLHAWKCIHRIRDGVLIRDVCMRVCLLQLNYFLLNGFTQPIKYERKEFGVCVRGGAPDEHRRRISFHFFFLFSFTSSSLFRLRYAKLEKAFQMEMLLEANRTEPNRHIHPYISNMPQFPAECLIWKSLDFVSFSTFLLGIVSAFLIFTCSECLLIIIIIFILIKCLMNNLL